MSDDWRPGAERRTLLVSLLVRAIDQINDQPYEASQAEADELLREHEDFIAEMYY